MNVDYEYNLNELLLMLDYNKKFKRKFNDDYSFIPFKTNQNTLYEHGFKTIIADYVRILNNKKWNSDITNEKIISEIMNNDNIEYEKQDKTYLNALIKSYLLNNQNEINIIHPHMYMYIPEIKGTQRSSELQVAQFLADVLFADIENVKDYFDFRDDDKTQLYYKNNILIDLILDNLIILPKKTYDQVYVSKLPYVTDVFKEDIEFGFEHEEFLTNNLEELLAYYYFFYVTQFSFKVYSKNNTLNEMEKFYYLVEDEPATINRKTINEGYSLIKDTNLTLLTKVLTVDYLNKLLNTKGLVYSEILEHLDSLNIDELTSFKGALIKFIKIYNEERKIVPDYELNINEDYKVLIQHLYDSLNEEFFGPARKRYLKCIEDIGLKFFLKNKGRYGYVLNISSDLLLTITALCIKEDKIKLKKLFEEYERRGLFFDKNSKIKIENLLTKLNLIDKKSDSGDAQYVRRIL